MKASLKKLLAYILGVDFRYPVGSYYETSDVSFDPNAAWGGTWVLEDEGRFLQATKVASKAGTTVEAGLPNITGSYNVRGYGESEHTNSPNGAFFQARQHIYKSGFNTPWNYSDNGGVGFDASRSNSIYGNSDTVQPKSRLVYMWHRTA